MGSLLLELFRSFALFSVYCVFQQLRTFSLNMFSNVAVSPGDTATQSALFYHLIRKWRTLRQVSGTVPEAPLPLFTKIHSRYRAKAFGSMKILE